MDEILQKLPADNIFNIMADTQSRVYDKEMFNNHTKISDEIISEGINIWEKSNVPQDNDITFEELKNNISKWGVRNSLTTSMMVFSR